MGAKAIRRGNLTLYPNYKLGEELRRTSVYDDELRRLTADAALGAREIAVRVAYDQGDYYQSIHGDLGDNRRGLRVGRVVADDYKAHWIERDHHDRAGGVVKGKRVLAGVAARPACGSGPRGDEARCGR